MPTGEELYDLARAHLGEPYENIVVPKDDSSWSGPWDCTELLSWLVYQVSGLLYGCFTDVSRSIAARASSDCWDSDSRRLGKRVPVEVAAATIGGIVLRAPAMPGLMGHVAICDGTGNTIEARRSTRCVSSASVQGRTWTTGILIPGIEYQKKAIAFHWERPRLCCSNSAAPRPVVIAVQKALAKAGYFKHEIDGEYHLTSAMAVADFQRDHSLVIDGEVGYETALKLAINLDWYRASFPKASESEDPLQK